MNLKKTKKHFIAITISTVFFSIAGCTTMTEPRLMIKQPQKQQSISNSNAKSQVLENRFSDSVIENKDAVGSAVYWAQKYEETTVKSESLSQKNADLTVENGTLKQQVGNLQKDLTKTKKELQDANEFLQEMELQLTQWKANILGYREETNKIHTKQLQALYRILKLLGAETIEPEDSTQ